MSKDIHNNYIFIQPAFQDEEILLLKTLFLYGDVYSNILRFFSLYRVLHFIRYIDLQQFKLYNLKDNFPINFRLFECKVFDVKGGENIRKNFFKQI